MVVSLRGDERKVEQDSWSHQSSGDQTLTRRDRAILDLIEQRRYQPAEVAKLLGCSAGHVSRLFWSHWRRAELTPLLSALRDPKLIPPRDAAAFELTKILDYTILETADLLRINRGHLSRVLRAVPAKLRAALADEESRAA